MSDNTVPVSEMGIADDGTREALEGLMDQLHEHWAVEIKSASVNTSILAGVGHLKVELLEGMEIDAELHDHIVASGYVIFDPHLDGGSLTFRVTTMDVYETWSGMESPIED